MCKKNSAFFQELVKWKKSSGVGRECSQVIGTKKTRKGQGPYPSPISKGLSNFFGAMKRILAIRDQKENDTLRSLDGRVINSVCFSSKNSSKSDKGFEPTLVNQGSQSKVFA